MSIITADSTVFPATTDPSSAHGSTTDRSGPCPANTTIGVRTTMNTQRPASRTRNPIAILLLVTACLFGSAAPAMAQAAAPAVAAPVMPTWPYTSPNLSLDDLVLRTTGKPSVDAYRRYQGNLENYLRNSHTYRYGKAVEAVLAHTDNTRLRATGDFRRIIVTAVEGLPASPADLLEVDARSGRILRQIQVKTGVGSLIKALGDAKYQGMDLMTDQATVDDLRRRLWRARKWASVTGRPIHPDLQAFDNAVRSGRIMTSTVSGAPLPTTDFVEEVSKRVTSKAWKTAGTAAKAAGAAAAAGAASAGSQKPTNPQPSNSPQPSSQNTHAERPTTTGTNPAQAPKPGTTKPNTAKPTQTQARSSILPRKPLGGLARVIVPAGIVAETYQRTSQINDTAARLEKGEITLPQAEVENARTVGGAGGGWAGAWAGFKLGAAAGGAGGTVVPVAGNAVGATIGGIVGGIGGYIVGDAVGGEIAATAMEAVHRTGSTVSGAAKATGQAVGDAAGWCGRQAKGAWNWVWGD